MSEQSHSVQAALAHTVSRSLALYFARPIRLFRPNKLSGWQSLRALASQNGTSLSPATLVGLVRHNGIMLIPRHFVPPMCINALLGVVLWTSYSESASVLKPYTGHHPTLTAALAGAIAGGAQVSLVAAPAENVRILLEGGSSHHSWSHLWKEVFRGSQPSTLTKEQSIRTIRELRSWVKEVRGMAGRGWDGWGWGIAKDTCGFAVFFSIFDVTRSVAITAKSFSQSSLREQSGSIRKHVPYMIQAMTLVSGGVLAGLAYELLGRPYDTARRLVHLNTISKASGSPVQAVIATIRRDGLSSLFRVPVDRSNGTYLMRWLSRVGPWGMAFLAWEAFGSRPLA